MTYYNTIHYHIIEYDYILSNMMILHDISYTIDDIEYTMYDI